MMRRAQRQDHDGRYSLDEHLALMAAGKAVFTRGNTVQLKLPIDELLADLKAGLGKFHVAYQLIKRAAA